jgi:SAM-dependent methyltransferase
VLDPQLTAPSPWIVRWCELIPPRSRILDLACGAGRHAVLLAQRGHTVVAVDRDVASVGTLVSTLARSSAPALRIEVQCRDLEAQPWPYAAGEFDAIVVTNYLYRPLFAPMLAALKPGGILLYETFARGNERFGKPSNPDFLLEPGELLRRVQSVLRVIAYEDVYVDQPKSALVQRLCAINADSVPLNFQRTPSAARN